MKKLIQILTVIIAMVVCLGNVKAQSISTKEILSISIKGVPGAEQTRISGEYVVSPDGLIYLPLLKGGIRASGKSSSSLARSIESAYRAAEMYQNPRITVVSRKDSAGAQIDAQVISVGGFVKSPGQRPYGRGMTLFQALASAGGETAFGSIKRVELHRNGKRWTYDLRKPEHMRVKVYPGDTINVPQKTAFGN